MREISENGVFCSVPMKNKSSLKQLLNIKIIKKYLFRYLFNWFQWLYVLFTSSNFRGTLILFHNPPPCSSNTINLMIRHVSKFERSYTRCIPWRQNISAQSSYFHIIVFTSFFPFLMFLLSSFLCFFFIYDMLLFFYVILQLCIFVVPTHTVLLLFYNSICTILFYGNSSTVHGNFVEGKERMKKKVIVVSKIRDI